jgi:membrane protein YqaA with SNARE-associated domain
MTSYLVGRLIPQKQLNEKMVSYLRRYGAPATFFAFLPLVGDALCVAAGWLRIHWLPVLVFMAGGRLTRYLLVAWGTLLAS